MSRIDLQKALCDAIGSKNVYYQPPPTYKLEYPCIVYERAKKDLRYANNSTYLINDKYTITYIYKDADSNTPDVLLNTFKLISHDRTFKNDNLYHDVFTLYY